MLYLKNYARFIGHYTEAVAQKRRCIGKCTLQNSQENIDNGFLFSVKLLAKVCNIIQKRAPLQEFSRVFGSFLERLFNRIL